MSELITVKAAKDDGRVVVWEQDDRHPNGEIYVAGDGKTVQVAKTAKIQRLLHDGALVKSSDKPEAPASTPTLTAPFTDYDSLTSAEIIKRMETMTDAEKDAVRKYEAANRNRKGVVEA